MGDPVLVLDGAAGLIEDRVGFSFGSFASAVRRLRGRYDDQKSNGTRAPLFSINTTGCASQVSGSPLMPGESAGIPGRAIPIASGR